MQFLTLLPALLAAGSAFAANIQVVVGGNSTLTFNPSNVTAVVGDTIDFVLCVFSSSLVLAHSENSFLLLVSGVTTLSLSPHLLARV